MKVDFYHLTAQPLDRVLPSLAEKVVASGERLLVVVENDGERSRLDRLLWTYRPDSFLPHEQVGGEGDAEQPILLAPDVNAANRARNVLIADGVWRDDALDFDRVFHLFDEETVKLARLAWKALAARDGVERRYWKQNEAGRWEQVATG